MDAQRWREFGPLRQSALETARAWAIKELAMALWGYVRRGWAAKAWAAWLQWALRCQLAPVRKVAETIRKYLWGILNAIMSRATNALAEGMNARIQEIAAGLWLSQPGSLPQRDLLPLGRTRSLSDRSSPCPHNFLKRQLREPTQNDSILDLRLDLPSTPPERRRRGSGHQRHWLTCSGTDWR
jgi:hypothetical protein